MSRSRTPPRATLRPVAAGPRQHAPNPLAQLAQAQQMLASGQHAQVEPLLHAALAAPPLRAEARYLMAIAALMAGQPVASVGHARAAADDRPDDARFHFALGRALKASGDLDGAESAYRRALELQPDYPEALVSLGIVLKTRGDTEGAIALYDRVEHALQGIAVPRQSGHADDQAAQAMSAQVLGQGHNLVGVRVRCRAAPLRDLQGYRKQLPGELVHGVFVGHRQMVEPRPQLCGIALKPRGL